MSFKMEFEGFGDVRKALKETPRQAENAIAAALWQNAMDIQRATQAKVPVDTGTLRRSWVVDAPKKNGGTISVTVGYGTHYALYVHEMTSIAHDPGQAKFLEDGIKEEASVFEGKLARRTMKILESPHSGIQPKKMTGEKYRGDVK